MIYLEKNDVWDEVWLRYKESYNCTNDCELFVPEKDIDYFCLFLRKNMRNDLKQSQKDAKKLVKRMRRAERKARRKAMWAKLKSVFSQKKENPQDPKSEKPETLPQPIQDNAPLIIVEQNHEQ